MKKMIFALCAIGMVSCGPPPPPQYGGDPMGAKGCPQWVDTGQSMQYSDMMYLTGVGHGQDQASCENDARAALSKIFKAQVSQYQTEWQGYFSKASTMGGTFRAEATNITSLTTVSTDKAMEGTKIGAHCQDNTATHHCLAALERDPAAAALAEKIARLDAEIRAKVQQGDSESSPTQKFMNYSAALERLAEREALNMDLRIISARSARPSPVDVQALLAKFTGARGQIKVGLKIQGTEGMRIQTCLAQGLTGKGMQVLEGSSDVDLWIYGTLKYQKAGYVEGSEMVRADVNLRIVDPSNGRTLAAFAEDVKVGRQTLQQSVQLAVSKLCDMASTTLVQKIRDSFHK
jgi:hypothetical protein